MKSETALQVVKLINELRKDPKSFAANVKTRLDTFDGFNYFDSEGVGYRSIEGKSACQEAYDYLLNAKPTNELIYSEGLSRCSESHCDDLSRSGEVSHVGSDGCSMGKRIDKFGSWAGKVGEVISVMAGTPMEIMLQWIVCDGVKGRGDRLTLLSGDFTKFGVSFNSNHKEYETCTVAVFAGVFGEEGDQNGPSPVHNANLLDEMPQEFKKLPDGAKGMTVSRKTMIENGQYKVIYIFRYDMADGTQKEVTKEVIQK